MSDAFARLEESLGLKPQPRDYVFSEIITFHVPPGVDLEDAASEHGKIWESTVKTFAENEGAKLIWWGRLLEIPEVLKLVVDWRKVEAYEQFRDAVQYENLQELWSEFSDKPVSSQRFAFPHFNHSRNAFFTASSLSSPFKDIVSCILTFDFSSTPPSEDRKSFDRAWELFSHAALKSEGGVVASNTCAGWSRDLRAFCCVIRYMDTASMKQYLARAEIESDQLKLVIDLADRRVNMEFVGPMWCLEKGWLGSVTENETEEDKRRNEQTKNMFADWNRKGLFKSQPR